MMTSMKKMIAIQFLLMWGALGGAILLTSHVLEKEEAHPFPEDPLKGSKLFVSKGCLKCHAIWGIGDSLGPDLALISKETNLLQLAGLLWSHSPKMIEIMQERGVMRPIFTPQEMADLMGYIYYFNYFDKPGDFAEGERLFVEKGCQSCHTVGQVKDRRKMALDEYGKYVSPSFLMTGLWNHSPEILSEMRRMGIRQPEFIGEELSHLIAYIRGEAENPEGTAIFAEPGSPKRGKDLFVQKQCNVCHAVWGEGGRRGSDMGRRAFRMTLDEISGRIWSHSGQMWEEMKTIDIPFPIFSPKEMADLISYLYFIQFYDEKGDVQRGKRLFREKACIFCHALEGEGENVGPDLVESEIQFSPIFLASAMWNHAVIMENMLEEKDLSWPRFSGNEMRDLVTYVEYAALKGKKEKIKAGAMRPESKVLFLSADGFDLEMARKGKTIYMAKACNACHTTGGKRGDLMGGDLGNITKIRDLEWLFNFIKDPKSMFKTDGLAKQLLREFKDIPMPQQGLRDEEVIAIVEYLKAPEKVK